MSRSLARLLLAGAAMSLAVGTAAAQSNNTPAAGTTTQPSGGGLVLPGTVQSPGGSAAGTINPQARPQPAPQAPAAAPQAQQQQRPQAQAQAAKPKEPAKVGTPTGEWKVSPEVFSDGAFKMCVTGNQFDNGLELLFLKNPENKVNLILGVPGARMQQGARLPVKVKIDSSLERERPAAVTQPEALVIALGEDAELIKAIGTGSVLSVEVPGDVAQFRLKGTAKAMTDLSNCVTQAMEGKLELPPPPPAMPPQLAQMLVAAGLKDARALPVDRFPPEQKPGDFAWQIGQDVLGSVRGLPVPASAGDIGKVPETYLERLKQTCEGTFTQSLKDPEKLKNFGLRTGEAICKGEKETAFVSLLFQLVPGPEVKTQDGKTERLQLLNIFTHEAPEANRKVAEDATVNLAKVLRDLDAKAEAQPQQGQAPAPAAAGQ
ncbi:hypothetical protein [Indioceanicola profundi]|uniref:hypothetical protein n=1 Tax=Indioceanicola profundi TaxID=2220096 RepID=UPI000E6A9EB6|nr:hypothetical protein [Indioceanicola profundi]